MEDVKDFSELIDLPIMEFIEWAKEVNAGVKKSCKNALLISRNDTLCAREAFGDVVRNKGVTDGVTSGDTQDDLNTQRASQAFANYIGTFVVEKSILDKVDILDYMLKESSKAVVESFGK